MFRAVVFSCWQATHVVSFSTKEELEAYIKGVKDANSDMDVWTRDDLLNEFKADDLRRIDGLEMLDEQSLKSSRKGISK